VFRDLAFLNKEICLQGQQQHNQGLDVIVYSMYNTEQVDLATVLPSFMLEAPYSTIGPCSGYAD
jgi:hypothetical protein